MISAISDVSWMLHWEEDSLCTEGAWLLSSPMMELFSYGLRCSGHADLALAEVNVLITNDVGMIPYNRTYRGFDRTTNILAFPSIAKGDPWIKPPEGPLFLGDLILSQTTAMREALEKEISYEAHGTHLLVHGFLHLLHYDHHTEKEAQEMEHLEKTILAQKGWPDPYEED
jgi:probable rRNA maturation factor